MQRKKCNQLPDREALTLSITLTASLAQILYLKTFFLKGYSIIISDLGSINQQHCCLPPDKIMSHKENPSPTLHSSSEKPTGA